MAARMQKPSGGLPSLGPGRGGATGVDGRDGARLAHGRKSMSEQPFHLLPGTQVCSFVMADNFVDVISGPIGSGKTKGLCARIMRHIKQQRPSTADGLRKSRWAVVRNVYHDLDRSLIRTWLDLFPEEIYGRLNRARPPRHELAFADVRATIDFLALDKEDDVSKLRSVEYTGIAFNELSFIEQRDF